MKRLIIYILIGFLLIKAGPFLLQLLGIALLSGLIVYWYRASKEKKITQRDSNPDIIEAEYRETVVTEEDL